MKKEDLLIGVHSSKPDDGDAGALVNAIRQNGVSACLYSECVEKNILPSLTGNSPVPCNWRISRTTGDMMNFISDSGNF